MSIAHTSTLVESKDSFTWDEIKKHNNRQSCWIVVDGMVYDVTTWLKKHPGGDIVIINSSTVDCTDIFNAYHSQEVRKMLKCYQIGKVDQYVASSVATSFRNFANLVENSDLMVTNKKFYYRLAVRYFVLWVSAISCVLLGKDNFYISAVLGGFIMAVFFQQIAFLGHDLGHSSITHERKKDSLLGIFFGNMLTGISMGWWKATHNAHHVSTNSCSADPDIQHLPLCAISKSFFQPFFSQYHEQNYYFSKLAQCLIPYQAGSYYVIMLIARINLYVQSYIFLLSDKVQIQRRNRTNTSAELAGLVIFATWFSILLSQMKKPSWMFVYFFLSHGLAGILHIQITLSHFPMHVYAADEHPLRTDSFVEHQMKTSMDLECHPRMDWFHGGLQFQVSHHLFPRVPRHNLRRLQEAVKKFALENGLTYHSLGFFDANKLLLARLREVGHQARLHILSDMVNMKG